MLQSRRAVLTAGGAALGTMIISRPGAAQTRTITLAFGPATPVYALGPIADLKGYFREEGLETKFLIGNAGTHGRQSVAGGQAQVSHGDASHPLQLSTRGKKCKIIMSNETPPSISYIVVRKDLHDSGIDSVEKLASYKRPDGGKPVIAATAIGSGTWAYGTFVFESRSAGNAVSWVAGGGLNTMLPGLQTKQFDAIVCPPGWVLEAETENFGRVIFDPSTPAELQKTFSGLLVGGCLYALDDFIADNRPLVQSFVNGLYRAMRWMKTQPIDEVYALVGEKIYPGQKKPSVIAELGFDVRHSAYDGRIGAAAFERTGKIWYRPGTEIPVTKYEDIVDMTFVDAAHAKYK